MILHIPHASKYIPSDIKFDKEDITDDIQRMTDWHTDHLFGGNTEHTFVKLEVSRLVCDVERFIENEEMDAVGMGICYTVDSFGAPLRTVSDEEKDRIVNNYYIPHHAKLYESVKEELEEYGQVMIVDCHSFSNEQLPHEPSGERPDFCIGTDSYHTPVSLIVRLQKELKILGYTSVVNEPFAGTIVPMEYYHTNDNVKSVMIEVNRSLYMNNSYEYVKMRKIITDLINIINKY